ncbi:MAG: RHS repeat-associated core domain-containing protein, partial [Planctomycetes bacterium]|nr:RHS repeat-associated core domain-containing protein [Planctomycetota bacterium]
AYGEATILDPGGNERAKSVVGNQYMFQGRRYDSESGLYYFRNRMMSSELGRFLQRDPHLVGPMPYLFAGSIPVYWADPSGLQKDRPPPVKVDSNIVRFGYEYWGYPHPLFDHIVTKDELEEMREPKFQLKTLEFDKSVGQIGESFSPYEDLRLHGIDYAHLPRPSDVPGLQSPPGESALERLLSQEYPDFSEKLSALKNEPDPKEEQKVFLEEERVDHHECTEIVCRFSHAIPQPTTTGPFRGYQGPCKCVWICSDTAGDWEQPQFVKHGSGTCSFWSPREAKPGTVVCEEKSAKETGCKGQAPDPASFF